MTEASHRHIPRKHKKLDVRRGLTDANSGYFKTWRQMAQDPFTFPIAVVLYPIALVGKTTGMISKSAALKGQKTSTD